MVASESPHYSHRKTRKVKYKEKLSEEYASRTQNLQYLNEPLKQKLQSYYDALNGNHSYIDTHTGKQVHARTYRKRLEFAEEALEEIREELRKEVNTSQASSVAQYARSLYNIAIRDNEYLKDKNTRKSASAHRVRASLNSLEGKVVTHSTQTAERATAALEQYPSTPSEPTTLSPRLPSLPIESERPTSSPIYNALRNIDVVRERFSTSADISTYTNTGEKGDEETISSPISPDELRRGRGKLAIGALLLALVQQAKAATYTPLASFTGAALKSIFYVGRPLIAISAALSTASIQYNPDSFYIGSPSPSSVVMSTASSQQAYANKLPVNPYKQSSPSITGSSHSEFQNFMPFQPAITREQILRGPTPTKAEYLEGAKARAQAAIRQIKAERSLEKRLENPMLTAKEQEQEKAEQTKANFPSVRESILEIWERRSKARALAMNLPVVKVVTYHPKSLEYPDGLVETHFPNNRNADYSVSSQ